MLSEGKVQAEDLDLQPLSEEFLSPHVVIATDDPMAYQEFSVLLSENNFPCKIFTEIQEVLTYAQGREGLIVFLCWELPNTNIKSMTSLLSDKMSVDVIVFSSNDDVKNRAELASCGFEKTIQPPFNEKNFLMAVQKINSDRLAENEKILRKMRHHERVHQQNQEQNPADIEVEMLQEGLAMGEDNEAQVFSGAEEEDSSNSEQFEGAGFEGGHQHHQGESQDSHLQLVHSETEGDGRSHFKGDIPEEFSATSKRETEAGEEMQAVQEGAEGSSFEVVASEEADAEDENRELVNQLVDQLDDMKGEPEEEELLREESGGEVLSFEAASESEEAEASSGSSQWDEMELPPLPEVSEAPNNGPLKTSAARPDPGALSRRDWVLMVAGIIVGLGLCSYFLAQVFLLPLLKSLSLF